MNNHITLIENSSFFVRSRDGVLAGVCAGLAHRLGVESWLIRLIWLATVLLFGTGVLAYLVLAIALPREDKLATALSPRVLGVAARVAYRMQLDVGLVRAIFLGIGLASAGVAILIYLMLHFLLPRYQPATW